MAGLGACIVQVQVWERVWHQMVISHPIVRLGYTIVFRLQISPYLVTPYVMSLNYYIVVPTPLVYGTADVNKICLFQDDPQLYYRCIIVGSSCDIFFLVRSFAILGLPVCSYAAHVLCHYCFVVHEAVVFNII